MVAWGRVVACKCESETDLKVYVSQIGDRLEMGPKNRVGCGK